MVNSAHSISIQHVMHANHHIQGAAEKAST